MKNSTYNKVTGSLLVVAAISAIAFDHSGGWLRTAIGIFAVASGVGAMAAYFFQHSRRLGLGAAAHPTPIRRPIRESTRQDSGPRFLFEGSPHATRVWYGGSEVEPFEPFEPLRVAWNRHALVHVYKKGHPEPLIAQSYVGPPGEAEFLAGFRAVMWGIVPPGGQELEVAFSRRGRLYMSALAEPAAREPLIRACR